MKNIFLTAGLTLFISGFAYAESVGTAGATTSPQETKMTPKKSDRKKKVEMCAECGKPESECECHDAKKKDNKS